MKILTLDPLAGRLAPFEFLAYLDYLICVLLSLSKAKWILYIDFLPCPCGLLFKCFLMHAMALELLGLVSLKSPLLCVTGEMVKGTAIFPAVPVFPLLAELLQAESVTL